MVGNKIKDYRDKSKNIFIVPARSGSKGISDKNIYKIKGKPLLCYTLDIIEEYCNNSGNQSFGILSSDSSSYLSLANSYKHTKKDLRPNYLAEDSTLTIDVIRYLIDAFNISANDNIILLQPTVPYRTNSEIKEILQIWARMESDGFKSLVSLVSVGSYHPFRFKRLLTSGQCISYIDQGFEDMRPRQDLPDCYIRSGSYYLAKCKNIVESNSLVVEPCGGYVHKDFTPINIDSLQDLEQAIAQIP